MSRWIRVILDKLGWPKKSPTIPETPNLGVKKPETEVSGVSDLVASPSLDMPRHVSETRVALQIGFDFGTHSTKVVVRRRGDRVGHAICVGGSVDGYPSFATPSLVRVSDGTVWFGGGALDASGGTLYRFLKLDLINLASPPQAHDDSTDFLVAAYFGWILSGIREWIEKRYGIGNAKLFLNVAAPMDHYEDVRIKQRYLKILGMAWECIFGDVQNLVIQGMTKSTLATWFARDDIVVPQAAVRPYDVLPETIAPIVSLSQDPRMASGMYLLVDMGAGTTELSIDHVSVPGGDQNVLCYYDRSVLLGAERFHHGKDHDALISDLLKHIWQTWCRGYEKDAANVAARQRWKSLHILLVGGGTLRTDVNNAIGSERHAVFSRFPGEGRCEILRHGPADLDFGPLQVSSEDISLVSVANGLAFPRMQWPRFFEPEHVPIVAPTPVRGGQDPWYMER